MSVKIQLSIRWQTVTLCSLQSFQYLKVMNRNSEGICKIHIDPLKGGFSYLYATSNFRYQSCCKSHKRYNYHPFHYRLFVPPQLSCYSLLNSIVLSFAPVATCGAIPLLLHWLVKLLPLCWEVFCASICFCSECLVPDGLLFAQLLTYAWKQLLWGIAIVQIPVFGLPVK